MAVPLQSQVIGGTGGNPFDDNGLGNIVGVASLVIHSGDQVDGIQATYIRSDNTTVQGPYHGGQGGSLTTLNFAAVGEVIVQVDGKTNGVLVDQLTFVTRKQGQLGTTYYGPFGITGATPFSVKGRIASLSGRSGTKMDAIQFRFYP